MSDRNIQICAVGDIRILEHEPHELLQYVEPTLRAADITFGQLETPCSARGQQQAGIAFRAPPGQAGALREAGFDVLSLAGNHCMDFGPEALVDTVRILNATGLKTIGTGSNLDEARRPAVFELDGVKIGFLAFNSVMPHGAWAEEDKPGCNAIRIYSSDGQFYSGETSAPMREDIAASVEDLDAMARAVTSLKSKVDVVIVSLHWGISFMPRKLLPYQEGVGHAAIDAGADLVIGHHPHLLKAVETYRGRVIFYSIGNFAFDQSRPLSAAAQSRYPGYKVDPEYAGYTFPADCRRTVVVKCTIAGGKVARVALLPAWINGQAQPQIVSAADPRFDDVVSYLRQASEAYGYASDYRIEGDEVVIAS